MGIPESCPQCAGKTGWGGHVQGRVGRRLSSYGSHSGTRDRRGSDDRVHGVAISLNGVVGHCRARNGFVND